MQHCASFGKRFYQQLSGQVAAGSDEGGFGTKVLRGIGFSFIVNAELDIVAPAGAVIETELLKSAEVKGHKPRVLRDAQVGGPAEIQVILAIKTDV
ncbi:hypothetical protein D3C87_1572620 [compost metagenome]